MIRTLPYSRLWWASAPRVSGDDPGQTHSKPAEWFAWNRTALDAIDRAVASATEKDEATQAEPVADPATDRQIAYIERLLINRRRNGEGAGFITIPECSPRERG